MVIDDRHPLDRLVTEGWRRDDRKALCRSCGAEIVWMTTPVERKIPFDPDGRSHFATCPDADSWRGRTAHTRARG